jgi:carbon storage regulator
MLVLSRKKDEQIVITLGSQLVTIKVVDVRGDRVRLGVDAPASVSVHRQEIHDAIAQWDAKPALCALPR